MINIKMKSAIGIYQTLMPILDQKYDITLSYKIAKLMKLLEPEMKAYEDSKRELVNRYGEISADNHFIYNPDGSVKIKPEFIPACQAETEQFLNIDLELNTESFDMKEIAAMGLTTPRAIMALTDIIV